MELKIFMHYLLKRASVSICIILFFVTFNIDLVNTQYILNVRAIYMLCDVSSHDSKVNNRMIMLFIYRHHTRLYNFYLLTYQHQSPLAQRFYHIKT